jgi:hypothetical protein
LNVIALDPAYLSSQHKPMPPCEHADADRRHRGGDEMTTW